MLITKYIISKNLKINYIYFIKLDFNIFKVKKKNLLFINFKLLMK